MKKSTVLGGVMVVMIGALIFILIKSLAGDVSLSPTQAVVNTLIPLNFPPTQTKTPDLIPTQTMTLIPSPTLIPTMIGGGSGEIGFYQRDRDGNQEIYQFNADGGNLLQFVTQTPWMKANRLYLQLGFESLTLWIMIF